MGHLRVRHNAKARQSVKGGGSKKKGRRTDEDGPAEAVEEEDANREIVVPKTKEEKERERREKLKAELQAQSETKWTAKKRKRMDNWISKKIAKEERVALLQKISEQQSLLPSSIDLLTSASLGSGRLKSHKERHEWREDLDVRRGMDGGVGGGRGRKRRRVNVEGDSEGSGDEEEGVDAEEDADAEYAEGDTGEMDVDAVADEEEWTGFAASDLGEDEDALDEHPADSEMRDAPQAASESAEIGSALARRLDGSVIVPVVVTRKRKPKAKKQRVPVEAASNSSFDSSDSAYDSSDSDADVGDGEEGEGEGETAESSGEQADPGKEEPEPSKARKLGFKDWAKRQLDVARGLADGVEGENEAESPAPAATTEPDPAPPAPKPPKPKPSGPSGPLGAALPLPTTAFALALRALPPNALNHHPINRPPDAASARLLLPIVAEEQQIVEAVRMNSVVVLCGETGSGKTTQVPGMLYEAGFGCAGSDNPGMIGVTQPRRVAAMSTSARVSFELSLPAPKVAYAVRYEHTTSPETAIKFMTDGVLLRELASDFLLERYSVVIVDEAHERTLGTDVLVGVLSRVVQLRERRFIEGQGKPLRLIIMSATLRISDFVSNSVLFPTPPPLIHIEARQYPVNIHFSRRTEPDYVSEAVRKVERIHTRLPPGGVLVFLTGQREIEVVCRRLERRWGRTSVERRKGFSKRAKAEALSVQDQEEDGQKEEPVAVNARLGDVEEEEVDLGDREDTADADEDEDGDGEETTSDQEYDVDDEEGERPSEEDAFDVPMHILPLYSLLPGDKQMRVFQDHPPNTRLVVVATNVAETSLTIPGIRYVVDSGRAKERRYDPASGIQTFQVAWESKASAAQRAGRAGRTGPGHCYRLYSSAVYENHFPQFAEPEILRMPIEGVVLQMKSMNIDAVANFPFPTPPDRTALKKAETLLVHLGALEPPSPVTAGKGLAISGRITELGKAMALFPVSPRFAKMLVTGKQHGCLPYVITIVASLSVGDPFLREEAIGQGFEEDEGEDDEMLGGELANIKSEELRAKEERKLRRRAFFRSQQAYAVLGNGTSDIFRILAVVGAYEYEGGSQEFCSRQFVRFKAMEEIRKLRSQIMAIVRANFGDITAPFTARLEPPTDVQLKALRQLITAGFIDQVAVRNDIAQPSSATGVKYSSTRGVPYRAFGVDEDVFIHPTSVLFHGSPPDYVIFLEIVRTSRAWIKTMTVINPTWLSSLGRSLCTFAKPVEVPASLAKKTALTNGNKREVHVIPRFGPAAWELPAILMVQRREGTRWVYEHK